MSRRRRDPSEGNPFAGISCLTCGSKAPSDREPPPPARPAIGNVEPVDTDALLAELQELLGPKARP